MQLKLSEREQEVLLETLEKSLSDLRFEIADTDNMDFREGLKGKERILNAIIDSLKRS